MEAFARVGAAGIHAVHSPENLLLYCSGRAAVTPTANPKLELYQRGGVRIAVVAPCGGALAKVNFELLFDVSPSLELARRRDLQRSLRALCSKQAAEWTVRVPQPPSAFQRLPPGRL